MAPHWALVSTSNRAILPHSPPSLSLPERPERGVPCSLLKLRQKGTHGVHMKGVLPRLVYWGRCAGTRDFCSPVDAQVSLVQKIYFSPHSILLHLAPSPSKLGRQSCWVAGPLICVSSLYIYCIHTYALHIIYTCSNSKQELYSFFLP
jgi:hypothetical protein